MPYSLRVGGAARFAALSLLMLTLSSLGCSSSPRRPDAAEAAAAKAAAEAAAAKVAAPTPADRIRAHIAWLPEGTTVVAVVEVAEFVEQILTSVYAPDEHPEQLENLAKMRAEISKKYIEYAGFDLLGADYAILAFDQGELILIVGGVEFNTVNSDPKQVAGYTVLSFTNAIGQEAPTPVVVLDDQTLAFVSAERDIEAWIKASRAPEAVAKRTEGLAPLLAQASTVPAWIYASVQIPENVRARFDPELLDRFGAPTPKGARISLSPEHARLELDGDPAELTKLADGVYNLYQNVASPMLLSAIKSDEQTFEFNDVARIHAEYLLVNYGIYLRDYKVEGGTLTYELPSLASDSMFPAVAYGTVSIAVPAFLRAVKKAKTSEAKGTLGMMANEAASSWRESARTLDDGSVDCSFRAPKTSSCQKIPSGGEKVASFFDPDDWGAFSSVAGERSERYFCYTVYTRQRGASEELLLEAIADFSAGRPAHTQQVLVTGDVVNGACVATIGKPVVYHEFE